VCGRNYIVLLQVHVWFFNECFRLSSSNETLLWWRDPAAEFVFLDEPPAATTTQINPLCVILLAFAVCPSQPE
jgi:hypothetical protein